MTAGEGGDMHDSITRGFNKQRQQPLMASEIEWFSVSQWDAGKKAFQAKPRSRRQEARGR